jgi:hypothetical protein
VKGILAEMGLVCKEAEDGRQRAEKWGKTGLQGGRGIDIMPVLKKWRFR